MYNEAFNELTRRNLLQAYHKKTLPFKVTGLKKLGLYRAWSPGPMDVHENYKYINKWVSK